MTGDTVLLLILAIIWGISFGVFRLLRWELLLASSIGFLLLPGTMLLEAGALSLSVESVLFSFFMSGIAATIYHIALGQFYGSVKSPKKQIDTDLSLIVRFLLFMMIFSWIAFGIGYIFPISPVVAGLSAGVLMSGYIALHRKDLLIDSLLSGLLLAVVALAAGAVSSAFETGDLLSFSGVYVLGVPANLLIWSFTIGIVLGPLYEYLRDMRLYAES
jgi:hypothetical protein